MGSRGPRRPMSATSLESSARMRSTAGREKAKGRGHDLDDNEWDEGEPVTVNTRDLINKVLARYSAANTPIRELCQNAADANAKNMVFRFESGEPGLISEEGLIPQHRPSHEDVRVSLEVLERQSVGSFDDDILVGKKRGAKNPKNARNARNATKQMPPEYPASSREKSTWATKMMSKITSVFATEDDDDDQEEIYGDVNPRAAKQHSKPPAVVDYTSDHHDSFRQGPYHEPQPDLIGKLGQKPFQRLIVKNDGMSFRDEDWGRLKRIAEGNPDVNKIGAFGVGFYSVFTYCDEPHVYSGSKAMAFFWNGKQLCTKAKQLPTHDPWTTFHLNFREPHSLPDIQELIKFLCTSLTFVGLESITLFVDDIKIFVVDKRIDSAIHDMLIPPGMNQHIPTPSLTNRPPVKMTIEKLECAAVAMKASYMRGIIPTSLPSENDVVNEVVCMNIWTAEVATEVEEEVAAELFRASMKHAPGRFKISSLGANGHDPWSRNMDSVFCFVLPGSSNGAAEAPFVNQAVIASKTTTAAASNVPGRVFIGFQTQQTTGFNVHLNTHSVIPTVERENVDFNADHVKTWNQEVMYTAGVLARIMYHYDMVGLVSLLERPGTVAIGGWVISAVCTIVKRYAFSESTPNGIVGKYIKEALFKTSVEDMMFLSSRGLVKISHVRLAFPSDSSTTTSAADSSYDYHPSSFFQNISFLHPEVVGRCADFEQTMRDLGFFKQVTVEEICEELKARVLDAETARRILMWVLEKLRYSELGDQDLRKIVGSLEVSVRVDLPKILEGERGAKAAPDSMRNVKLSTITTFINPSHFIPISIYNPQRILPIPADCISPDVTHNIISPDSIPKYFNWTELDVTNWISFLFRRTPTEKPIFEDPNIVRDVLGNLFHHWGSLPDARKKRINSILLTRPCIPTRNHGILPPDQVYLPTVKWGGDLIMFDGGEQSDLTFFNDEFLTDLGLKNHVHLDVVVEALKEKDSEVGFGTIDSNDGMECYHLVQYILERGKRIPLEEMNEIKEKEFCATEDRNQQYKLFRPREVYEPQQRLRDLGLPTLKWPKGWTQVTVNERNILQRLGVMSQPPLKTLAQIAANLNNLPQRRDTALKYLCEILKAKTHPAEISELTSIPFLPAELQLEDGGPGKSSENKLWTPSQIYLNPHSAILGFPVLRRGFPTVACEALRIPQVPPLSALIRAFRQNPPADINKTITLFSAPSGILVQGADGVRDVAFLPTELQLEYGGPNKFSENKLWTPSQIYLNPHSAILGFPVLRRGFPTVACDALRVPQVPPLNDLIRAFKQNTLTDPNNIITLFSPPGGILLQGVESVMGFPFLPVDHGYNYRGLQLHEKMLQAPFEIYQNGQCAILGFPILPKAFSPIATILKIRLNPPPAQLLTALQRNPPTSIEMLITIFGYLADVMGRDISSLRRVPFLPVNHALNYRGLPHCKFDQNTLRAPADIYQNKQCALLGFPVIQTGLPDDMLAMLLILKNPRMEDLTRALEKYPPTTVESATAIFEYLDGVGLNSSQHKRLGKAKIVPVFESDRVNAEVRKAKNERYGELAVASEKDSEEAVSNRYRLRCPNSLFLKSPEAEGFAIFFDLVDFGPKGNQFLESCGAGSEPSQEDIGKMMVMHPRVVFKVIGEADYKIRIKYLAMTAATSQHSKHPQKEGLYESMRTESWLLSYKEVENPKNKAQQTPHDAATNGEGGKPPSKNGQADLLPSRRVIQLEKAANIMIVDDLVNYKLFSKHIRICPEDDTLEKFYKELGSPSLSQCVHIEHTIKPTPVQPQSIIPLRSRIVERAALFLHENQLPTKYEITNKWLQDFKVVDAEKIIVRKILHAQDHPLITVSEDTNATVSETHRTLKHRGQTNVKTLYVISKLVKPFHIADALVAEWLEGPKASQAFMLEAFLRDDLQTLEKRGIHVKRILGDTSQAEVEAVAHFPAEVDNWEDNSTSQTLPKAKVEMDAITLPEKKRDPDILPINSLPSKSATPGGSDATASISNYPQKVPHATSAESSARYAQLRAKLLARNSWANDHSLQLCHDITPEILHQSLAGYIQQAEKRLEYEEEALGLLGVHPVVNATLGPFGATLARDAGFQIGEAAKESSKMMTVNDIIPPILHRSYQLEYYATSSLGQKIYLEQEGSAKSNNEFSRQLQASFNDFGKILGKIAEVFGLKAAHCRMFVIPSLNGTASVNPQLNDAAFHRDGCIFFNLKLFKEPRTMNFPATLHPMRRHIYWYMVMCHVLSFSLSSTSPVRQSSYMAALATEFWAPITQTLISYTPSPAPPLAADTPAVPKQ